MEDWIKKWYKDQYEKIDLSPSSSVWENISVSMEEWPRHWFKANMEDMNSVPRTSTWEALSSQLAQIRYPAKPVRPSYGVLSIILVLFIVLPFNFFDGYIDHSEEIKKNKSFADISEFLPHDGENKLQHTLTEKLSEKPSAKVEENKKDYLNKRIPLRSSLNISPPFLSEGQSFKKPLNLVVDDSSEDDKSVIPEQKNDALSLSPLVVIYPCDSPQNLIHINDVFHSEYLLGISLQSQFSTLLTPLRTEVIKGSNSELLNPLSYGVTLHGEKWISSKHGIRAEVNLNNVKSFIYKDYVNSSAPVLKSMRLNYTGLGISYLRMWYLDRGRKYFLKSQLGIYTSYAISKKVDYGGMRIPYLEKGFRTMDLGNAAGVSIGRDLSRNTRMEIGLYSQLGVINIFKGSEFLPASYFRTNSLSYGLNLSISKKF
ncbi:MAG: hypothetical protein R3277_06825 [Brumimicrobium sp.]|nr:hypothetical protein [Brumimicrobium sp.]